MYKIIVFIGNAGSYKSTLAAAFKQYSMTHVDISEHGAGEWSRYKNQLKKDRILVITSQTPPPDNFPEMMEMSRSNILYVQCENAWGPSDNQQPTT